jgi:hypothetical protein
MSEWMLNLMILAVAVAFICGAVWQDDSRA